MGKTYVTANNRVVDIDALRLKNEDVRAVGNMGVNARGDKIDSNNGSVESRNRRVSRQYKKQTNVSDQPVASSIAEAKRLAEERAKNVVNDDIPREVDSVSLDNTTPKPVTANDGNEEPEGLAAAIARAREVKQEEIVPPRKAAQQKPGVKKI